jgi:hypothetical protein
VFEKREKEKRRLSGFASESLFLIEWISGNWSITAPAAHQREKG